MKRLFTAFLFLPLVLACTKIDDADLAANYTDVCADEQIVSTRSETGESSDTSKPIILGERQPIVYSVANMRKAYENLPPLARTRSGIKSALQIKANMLYVRFLPTDTLQLRILQDSELELFDYPLEYDVVEWGDYYHDPTVENEDFTWLYTTVPIDYAFPSELEYEIIEECYIVDNADLNVNGTGNDMMDSSDTTSETNGNSSDLCSQTEAGFLLLEEQAFIDAGLMDKSPEQNASTMGIDYVYPKGYLYVEYDYPKGSNSNIVTKIEPVKGVKIRCHSNVRVLSTHTNENGYYQMPKKFSQNYLRYNVVFKNSKDFNIWDTKHYCIGARENFGWHSKSGYTKTIKKGERIWSYCVVNNAAYDHYVYCNSMGINKPPKKLKIFVMPKSGTWGSAPMLKHCSDLLQDICDKKDNIKQKLEDWCLYWLVGIVDDLLKYVAPDIIISPQQLNANSIYELVSHELMHASHFSQVGQDYWKRYIAYILTCWLNKEKLYGTKDKMDSGVCISETWAYAMGNLRELQMFSDVYYDSGFPTNGYSEWFKPRILQELMMEGVLLPIEIFQCMKSDIDNHELLLRQLLNVKQQKYDYDNALIIWQKFFDNGFQYLEYKPNPLDYQRPPDWHITPNPRLPFIPNLPIINSNQKVYL